MPRPRYQMTDADVTVVHRWVRSKFRETAPLDHPTTEQLQQWCDRCLDAAQWKQLHAVIRNPQANRESERAAQPVGGLADIRVSQFWNHGAARYRTVVDHSDSSRPSIYS